MQTLPETLVSKFAIATRDVLWYKDRVLRVLERAGVPSAVMKDVRARKEEPTIKLAQGVVDLLEQMGDEGQTVLQRLFAEVADWDDLSHLKLDRQKIAKASQVSLKEAIASFANQQKYHRRQEKEQQKQREARLEASALDHGRLQRFRDTFDAAFAMQDHQERGNTFERLLNEVFDYYCPRNRGPFSRVGEQVDGHFVLDSHHYFCEVRWKAAKATSADVSVLRDRASAAFGGDVKALFVSFEGFTEECLEQVVRRSAAERVILMDGMDFRSVLNADIAFDLLLEEKQAVAVRDQRAFVSSREIILARLATS